ncbi:cytochrome c oxidase subunit III protein [Burkholderia paludis]|uniref:Cytochrome c oxidase subunit III protein n=2 Tax=Burkholderiaceae TaxID=119060 RepID=A0A6J5EZM7_9BURK|nr:cytochrome c oxidase subunit 3 [Burkholderia paludis]CAB3772060.1 Cytochrome c oxidase subunit 3 [Burkholderia paludis]VWC41696.1 cytochrome c oxidase subunit III protein [Burkholderia paludis]
MDDFNTRVSIDEFADVVPQDARAALVPGILFFIIADIATFGIFFVAFMIERRRQISVFDGASRSLNVEAGLLNALILMTSGMFVAFAVDAARRGRAAEVRRWLMYGMLVGVGFGVNKAIEYGDKFSHGIGMLTNDFFMFYYVLTGAHFIHFLAGMIVLAALWFRAAREPVHEGPLFAWIEGGALYWHMVDLLWIVIFPMLYLVGRQ